MATQTTHYSLVKPAYEDQADVGVLNGDLDQIDELIYNANNDVRPVTKGGTGASTVPEAQANLGISGIIDKITNDVVLSDTASVTTANAWEDTGLTFTTETYALYGIKVNTSSGQMLGIRLLFGTARQFEYESSDGNYMTRISPVFFSMNNSNLKVFVKCSAKNTATITVYRILKSFT